MIFFPLSFQSVSFYFHTPAKCIPLYSQFSMTGFILSGKWTIRTLKIPIIRFPQRFIFRVPMKRMESQARKKWENIFFSNKMLLQGKGGFKINSLTAFKKQTKSKRLLKEIFDFTHLHHYQDSFTAVLILPDMLEEEKITLKGGCDSSSHWTNDSVPWGKYQKTRNATLFLFLWPFREDCKFNCLTGEDFLQQLDLTESEHNFNLICAFVKPQSNTTLTTGYAQILWDT